MVSCNTADKAWPEALRDKVGQPEPPHGRLVKTVDVHLNVAELVVWFGEVGLGWHEGGNYHLGLRQLESYFKFL